MRQAIIPAVAALGLGLCLAAQDQECMHSIRGLPQDDLQSGDIERRNPADWLKVYVSALDSDSDSARLQVLNPGRFVKKHGTPKLREKGRHVGEAWLLVCQPE